RAEVRYARWKSRVDLPRLLNGAGDLDLLVDSRHGAEFLRVADGLGFAPVVSSFEPTGAQEMHLYGLDHDSGLLLHLHVILRLGDRDLDELVLATASGDSSGAMLAGMPVVNPAAELIAFVLRAMDQYSRWGALPRLAADRERMDAKLHTLLTTGAAD